MLDTLTACALPATVCSASSGPVNVTVIASGVGGGTGDAPYGGLGGTEPRASGGPVTGAPTDTSACGCLPSQAIERISGDFTLLALAALVVFVWWTFARSMKHSVVEIHRVPKDATAAVLVEKTEKRELMGDGKGPIVVGVSENLCKLTRWAT